MSVAAFTPAERRRSLTAVMASAGVAGISIGMNLPLLSLVLERDGVSFTLIGLNAAMTALATLAAGPFIPRLMGAIGALATVLLGMGLAVVAILLFPVFHNLPAWFVLRGVLGVGVVMAWVASEVWIVALSAGGGRGRIMGVYNMIWAGGFAAGPLVLGLVGSEGTRPFLVSAAVAATTALPLLFARGLAPEMPARPRFGIVRAVRAAPTPFLASLLAGFSEVAIFALLPLYGLRSGFDETAAVTMLSVLIAGGVVLQLPIGRLADRIAPRRLLGQAAGFGLLGAVLLPFAMPVPALLWPMLFVWGGMMFGLYTVALVALGERFQGEGLGAANAAFIMMYEAGTLAGPLVGGTAMDVWDPYGLPALIATAFAAFLVLVIARARRARPPREDC